MERIVRNIFRVFRLAVVLALFAALSPGPEFRPAHVSALAANVSALSGDLRIVIQKSRYVLTLYKGMTPVKSYWAAFGKGYQGGDKRKRGDKRTPEGEFYICTINHSKRFYKFLGLSYPGVSHANNALERGIITPREYDAIRKAHEERRQPPWETGLGGAVGIHGRIADAAVRRIPDPLNWTDGCIALNNEDVDEIYSVVSVGTPVIIVP